MHYFIYDQIAALKDQDVRAMRRSLKGSGLCQFFAVYRDADQTSGWFAQVSAGDEEQALALFDKLNSPQVFLARALAAKPQPQRRSGWAILVRLAQADDIRPASDFADRIEADLEIYRSASEAPFGRFLLVPDADDPFAWVESRVTCADRQAKAVYAHRIDADLSF